MTAPIWFLIALLLFGALRTEFSHSTKAVSELGAWGAPHALAWNVLGFGTVGALVMTFAWGLWNYTSSWLSAFSVGISGLGFAAAGIFPADMGDMQAFSTRMHIIGSLVSFAGFAAGVFAVGWTLWRRPAWRKWAIISVVVGLLAIASLLLRETAIPTGLAQRINFLAYLLWIAVLAAGIWRKN
jgi:hypothetical membrane protein